MSLKTRYEIWEKYGVTMLRGLNMKEKLTEADKFTVAVNNAIEESEFENYGAMMLRRYNQIEAKRIAKEIDEEIMSLGEAYITIKVKKVDLPDDFVKTMESGVNLIEELKEYKKEMEDLKKEIKAIQWKAYLCDRDISELIYQQKATNRELVKANFKIDKLEGDLEYAKCSGWLRRNEWIYPLEPLYSEYPIITYSNINPCFEVPVTVDDIFKAVT